MHQRALLVAALALTLAASLVSLSPAGGAPDPGNLTPEVRTGPPARPAEADVTLSIGASTGVADPGDQVILNGTARNLGDETATNVSLEASLDPNATYVGSVPAATYDEGNRTLRWTPTNLSVGSQVDVFWTLRVMAGTPDGTIIPCPFRGSYDNATGVPQPPVEVETSVQVRAPVFDPQLRPSTNGAGRSDTVIAKLYLNNTGSGTAFRAWSNWTLGGHFRFLLLEEPVTVTNVSDGFRVTLSSLAPGPHSLTAHLEVIRGLDDGLVMGIQTYWNATDGNGNGLVPSTTGTTVDLLAPSFTIGMNASALRVNTTSRFVLTVTIRNMGRAPGIGWLNTTLPSGPSFVSDNGSFPRAIQGKRYSWTLPSVSPGNAIVLGITFESSPDPRTASFAFALDFTDLQGSAPASVEGPRMDVEFVALPIDPPVPGDLSVWAFVAAGAGGSVAVFALWRRRRASDLQIEDVFVADMAGHLLAHRSSGLVAYEDEDILIGMFKVIQDFVKDSFGKATNDTMKSMEFGERRIIIERGRYHFISVVYRGRDRGDLSERVLKVSRLIDRRFGPSLENWSGDLDELRGLATLLPQVWKHQSRGRAPVQPEGAAKAGSEVPPGGQRPGDPGQTDLAADPSK